MLLMSYYAPKHYAYKKTALHQRPPLLDGSVGAPQLVGCAAAGAPQERLGDECVIRVQHGPPAGQGAHACRAQAIRETISGNLESLYLDPEIQILSQASSTAQRLAREPLPAAHRHCQRMMPSSFPVRAV